MTRTTVLTRLPTTRPAAATARSPTLFHPSSVSVYIIQVHAVFAAAVRFVVTIMFVLFSLQPDRQKIKNRVKNRKNELLSIPVCLSQHFTYLYVIGTTQYIILHEKKKKLTDFIIIRCSHTHNINAFNIQKYILKYVRERNIGMVYGLVS